jgi:hypothetical protein
MEARVFFFDDGEDPPGDDLANVVDAAGNLLKEIAGIDADFDASTLDGHIPPKQLSFAIAALEGFAPAERQGFLEMTSSSERLKKCVQALSRIVARNRLTREIQQMIGGNGHPPRSILKELREQRQH